MASNRGKSLIVAAIDFGTTYSGWAFSFRHEFEADPIKVSAKQWIGGQLVSQKGPTCILFHPDGETVHSFGYDAESKYADLAEDGEHESWYFFKQFKMTLFKDKGLTRVSMLEDASKKHQLPAKKVFAASIKFLKDDLIKVSESRITSGGVLLKDIHWVLTVPAIWNDAAKQFMREAAEEAGIPSDNLTIALEPECASLYCRHLPVGKGNEGDSLSKFKPGTKYMVLDAGGGTVDITIHEVTPSGALKELMKASGGAWGGTKVDATYKDFMGKMFKPAVMGCFEEECMEDFIEMFRDFEIKKRKISPDGDSKMTFRLPLALSNKHKQKTGQDVDNAISTSPYSGKVKVISGDKLRVDGDVVITLFNPTVQDIIRHVRSLLSDPAAAGCNVIVMVGGFSESPMLQKKVKAAFPRQKFIIPQDAGLAVLKGAVIYGHSPSAIAERVCKLTYGTNASHTKSESCSHPPGRTYQDSEGLVKCGDIFSIHANIGDRVKLGEEQEEQIYTPVEHDQTEMVFNIYASKKANPYFVTESDSSKIGSVRVPLPDTRMGKDRKVGVSFMFGGTEIAVKCVEKATGKVTITHVDFLG